MAQMNIVWPYAGDRQKVGRNGACCGICQSEAIICRNKGTTTTTMVWHSIIFRPTGRLCCLRKGVCGWLAYKCCPHKWNVCAHTWESLFVPLLYSRMCLLFVDHKEWRQWNGIDLLGKWIQTLVDHPTPPPSFTHSLCVHFCWLVH